MKNDVPVTVKYEALMWWYNVSYSEAVKISTQISNWLLLEIMYEHRKYQALNRKGGENHGK